jgi:hypothetical protein
MRLKKLRYFLCQSQAVWDAALEGLSSDETAHPAPGRDLGRGR